MATPVIAFIEDSDLDFEMGVLALRRSFPDVEVFRAYGCCDGKDVIQKHAPLLVLLDLNLHTCNGLDLLQFLNANAADGAEIRPKVVVFTSSTSPVDRQRSLSLGATDFRTKPSDPEQFLQEVMQATAGCLN